MKKAIFISLGLFTFSLFLCLPLKSLHALSMRFLALKDVAIASKQADTWGGRVRVKSVTDVDGVKEVTVEVVDPLAGPYQKGQNVTLHFVTGPVTRGNLRLSFTAQPAVYLTPGLEVVMFPTRDRKGFDHLVGGDQTLYFFQNNGIYNKYGYTNIVDPASTNPTVQSILTNMRMKQTGAVPYEGFKTLWKEANEGR